MGAALSVLALGGCVGGDSIVEPMGKPGAATWRIQLNHPAVTLAVGQSVQLVATPMTVSGIEVTPRPQVTWSSNRLDAATIDAAGVLRAAGAGNDIAVIASVRDTVHNITRSDTVLVTVTATPGPLLTFKHMVIPQSPLDSGRVGAGIFTPLPIVATGSSGPVSVAYRQWVGASSIGKVVLLNGMFIPVDTGRVVLYAKTFAYNTEYIDSLVFVVTPALNVTIQIYDHAKLQDMYSSQPGVTTSPIVFSNIRILPEHVEVRKGGTVTWQNLAIIPQGQSNPIPQDKLPKITFEPLDGIVPAEHLVAQPYPIPNVRQFTKEGVYWWTNPASGQRGSITVTP